MSTFTTKTTAARANRFRPEVQALEDRQLMSVTSTFSGGVLRLDGNSAADQIRVTHDGNGLVTGRATGIRSINQSGVRFLRISTGGGNDTITFTQTGDLTRDFALLILGGDDNDRVSAVLQGDILANRTMDILVDGGKNSDSNLSVDASQDVDIHTGARLLVGLEGGPSSFLGRFSDDRMSFRYRGQVVGLLDVDCSGGPGNDDITAELRLDAGSTGLIGGGAGSRMSGGNDADRMTFLVSDFSGATITAQIDGGPGRRRDVGTHTTNVSAIGLEQNSIVNFQ